MNEAYTREIKAVTSNGTKKVIIKPTTLKRVFSVQTEFTMPTGGGAGQLAADTLAAAMAALTVRAKVGSSKKWELSGTKLRDWMLLHGTTFDFNGVPSTGVQMTLAFAPEWFLAAVADSLAWNPKMLGGEISIELESTVNLTIVRALETIADDLDAASSGILTLENITTVAGGVSFYTGEELEMRGRLVSASIYPDSTNSREITPAGLYLGTDNAAAHEDLSSAQNDEQLERKSLTPAATGRTANVYDIVPVKDDLLARGYNLAAWKKGKIKIQAGAAMGGTVETLLCRLEDR